MIKLDLKKDLKAFYNPPSKTVTLVNVPPFNFARIDGVIEPGCRPGDSPGFEEAISTLYGISYTLKFMFKKRPVEAVDYPVMALEGLWFTDEGSYDFDQPAGWKYTAQIMQPEVVTADAYAEGLEQLRKKRGDTPGLGQLRFERVHEGLAVQIMHIGPYATEPESVAKMDAFAQAHGYRMRGKHHEIYLGDPRRADQLKLKTVLRHPVEK